MTPGSTIWWNKTHNFDHHVHTMEIDDPDNKNNFIRLNKNKKKNKINKYQHIYSFVLYFFASIELEKKHLINGILLSKR